MVAAWHDRAWPVSAKAAFSRPGHWLVASRCAQLDGEGLTHGKRPQARHNIAPSAKVQLSDEFAIGMHHCVLCAPESGRQLYTHGHSDSISSQSAESGGAATCS
jgi:hypothetical protein